MSFIYLLCLLNRMFNGMVNFPVTNAKKSQCIRREMREVMHRIGSQ